jgi:hypothetical protein
MGPMAEAEARRRRHLRITNTVIRHLGQHLESTRELMKLGAKPFKIIESTDRSKSVIKEIRIKTITDREKNLGDDVK